MEKQSGPENLSVISQVSAVEGCPLSGVPLYVSYALYIIMLARQFGKRCSQPSHNRFWTFSYTPLTVKPTWVFLINLIKHYMLISSILSS